MTPRIFCCFPLANGATTTLPLAVTWDLSRIRNLGGVMGSTPTTDPVAVAAALAALPRERRYLSITCDYIDELGLPTELSYGFGGTLDPTAACLARSIPQQKTYAYNAKLSDELRKAGVHRIRGVFLNNEQAYSHIGESMAAMLSSVQTRRHLPYPVAVLDPDVLMNYRQGWGAQNNIASGFTMSIHAMFLRQCLAPIMAFGPVANANGTGNNGCPAWPVYDQNGWQSPSVTCVDPRQIAVPAAFFAANQAINYLGIPVPQQNALWTGFLLQLDQIGACAMFPGQTVWTHIRGPTQFSPEPVYTASQLAITLRHIQRRVGGDALVWFFNSPDIANADYAVVENALAQVGDYSAGRRTDILPVDFSSDRVVSGDLTTTYTAFMAA